MSAVAQITPARLVIGVDTHEDVHVAVAVDTLGRRIADTKIPTTAGGYRKLVAWADSLGSVEAFGVEGTGSYGAALARHLRDCDRQVIEVLRPDRQARRRNGKSDPADAEAAARAVISGEATGTPGSGDDLVEMIRVLRVARSTAMKARTGAIDALESLVVTAPVSCATSYEGSRSPSWSRPQRACARGVRRRPSPRTRPLFGLLRAATRPSTPRSPSSTPALPSSPPKPLRGCSRPSVSAPIAPVRCSSQQVTTPTVSAPRPRSPCSAELRPSKHPQAKRSVTASTVAATARPTPPCSAS